MTCYYPQFDPMGKAKVQWEKDLGIYYSDSQWKKLKLFNQTFSKNVGIHESRFKILNRWYRTPGRTVKMYPQSASNCWRCQAEGADFPHIW